jgi:acetyl esterase/lipase
MTSEPNPLFTEYVGMPWLNHDESGPSAEALAVKPVYLEICSHYPMRPGLELDYVDDSTPTGYTREEFTTSAGQTLYHFRNGDLPADEKRVIYYIHGGGFMRGNGLWCRKNAIVQAVNLSLPVFACEYRTTPASRWPAALDDVWAGYQYLIEELGYQPKNVIVTGESAGGNLAVALVIRLKRLEAELPGRLIALSPSLDLKFSTKSMEYNLGKDLVFTDAIKVTADYYADPDQLQNPEVSPLYADFTGFPPTYLCAEDTEIFCSEILVIADKLYRAGTKVCAFVSHGLWHAFPLETPEIPEAQTAFAQMREWIA